MENLDWLKSLYDAFSGLGTFLFTPSDALGGLTPISVITAGTLAAVLIARFVVFCVK
jgi:hypothetical protein